jgi:FMN reductase
MGLLLSGARAPVRVVSVVGNPRPASRTHAAAATLRDELASVLAPPGEAVTDVVDLAAVGPALLDPGSPERAAAVAAATSADVLVVASPTYKATYTGLLKLLFDAFGPGALAGRAAVGLMVGAGPGHALAVDVHLTPLLLEVGAACPARGLYVLEAELPTFAARARDFAAAAGPALLAAADRG